MTKKDNRVKGAVTIAAEITVKNVCYQYSADSNLALDKINLTIKPGEFVAIIGPNGSGKSTLAKLLNGIFVPTQGDVFVDGLNTKDKEIGRAHV